MTNPVVVSSPHTTTVVVNTSSPESVVVTPPPVTEITTTEVEFIYIERPATAGPQGDPGDPGPPGPPGPARASGALENTFTYRQDTPASVWTVVHNLGTFPNVTVLDSTGSQVMGDLLYLDGNSVQLTFSAPFSGVAYLI
jgi:hypothetical protein